MKSFTGLPNPAALGFIFSRYGAGQFLCQFLLPFIFQLASALFPYLLGIPFSKELFFVSVPHYSNTLYIVLIKRRAPDHISSISAKLYCGMESNIHNNLCLVSRGKYIHICQTIAFC